MYIYISQQPDLGTLLVTTGLHGSVGGLFGPFLKVWTELMHPEAYLDRLASTKQVSDLKNIIRGPFSSILLTSVSVMRNLYDYF